MKNIYFSKLVGPVVVTLALVGGINSHLLAKDTETKINETIDSISKSLQSAVSEAGDKIEQAQAWLNNYKWQDMFEVTSGPVALNDLKLNHHHLAVVVHPGEKIHAKVSCGFDPRLCSPGSVYRVVIGYKGLGAQTTIGTTLGLVAGGETREKFHMTAPSEPGLYEVRFRVVTGLTEAHALSEWVDRNGNEPDVSTTIGLVYVTP